MTADISPSFCEEQKLVLVFLPLVVLQGTLQQFVDNFFRSVLCTSSAVPPAVKYFFDFLDEQAERHDNVDEETLHIWKTNRFAESEYLSD